MLQKHLIENKEELVKSKKEQLQCVQAEVRDELKTELKPVKSYFEAAGKGVHSPNRLPVYLCNLFWVGWSSIKPSGLTTPRSRCFLVFYQHRTWEFELNEVYPGARGVSGTDSKKSVMFLLNDATCHVILCSDHTGYNFTVLAPITAK